MTRRDCYLCESRLNSILWKKNNFNIVICNNCGFIYVNRVPSRSYLNNFYRNFDYHDIKKAEIVIRRDAQRSLQKIDQFVTKPVKLLDVGCGRGFFLDEARKRGWEVSGIDYSNRVINYATNFLKLIAQRANIFTFKSKQKFDVVTLNQVIEHVSNPNKLIKQCYRLLKSTGIIYIATPNISSISAKIAKENFDYIIPPEHLGFFNNKTLSLVLIQNGFRVLYCGTWGYRQDVAGIIKKLFKKNKKTLISLKVKNQHERVNQIPIFLWIKYFLFDFFLCGVLYRILSFDHWGTNIEIIGIKI